MTQRVIYRPSMEELNAELKRIRTGKARRALMIALVVMMAVALVAGAYLSTTYLALMRVDGGSMEGTLLAGDVVIARKGVNVARGDVVAFERDGTLLIKRVIAMGGDQVNVSYADGTVSVNGVTLVENYVMELGLGHNDMEYPLTVPRGQLFVMGDHRTSSVDSRSSAVGLVYESEIIGRVDATIWPLERAGLTQQ